MMIFKKPLIRAANEAHQIIEALQLTGLNKDDKMMKLSLFCDVAKINRENFPTLWEYLESEDDVFTSIRKSKYEEKK